MEILRKDTIKKYILPYLQVGNCGKSLEPDFIVEIVSAILYRLKTGVQWRFLPVQFLAQNVLLGKAFIIIFGSGLKMVRGRKYG